MKVRGKRKKGRERSHASGAGKQPRRLVTQTQPRCQGLPH